MNFKILKLSLSVLVATAVSISASQGGIFIGKPLSVKGQNLGAVALGPVYTQAIAPEWDIEAKLSWFQVQLDTGTEGSMSYFLAGMYHLPYKLPLPLDAILGIAGNGFSGMGVVVGASTGYQLNTNSVISASLTYNSNQDFDFALQFVRELKEFKFPDFSGTPPVKPVLTAPEPIVAVEPVSPSVISSSGSPAVVAVAAPAPVDEAVTSVAYSDIANHWARADIQWAADRGIFAPADKFSPSASLNRFAAESVLKHVGAFLGVQVKDGDLGQLGSIVTKKEFTNSLLKVIAKSRKTTDVDQLIKELKVPTSWIKDASSTKAISRAETAGVVSKLVQAATK
jgi:hypothetical protein